MKIKQLLSIDPANILLDRSILHCQRLLQHSGELYDLPEPFCIECQITRSLVCDQYQNANEKTVVMKPVKRRRNVPICIHHGGSCHAMNLPDTEELEFSLISIYSLGSTVSSQKEPKWTKFSSIKIFMVLFASIVIWSRELA